MRSKLLLIATALVFLTALVPALEAQTSVLSEDFEGSFPPAGWLQNWTSPQMAWRRNSSYSNRSNYTGGGGYCADRDDDRYNISGIPYPGTWLRTSVMNCASYNTVWLAFNMSYNDGSSSGYDRARVEVSNNGSTWTMVREWNSDVHAYGPGYRDSINISSVAAGQPTVYVRFIYYESPNIWGWWFEVDRVRVWGTGGGGPGNAIPDNLIKNSNESPSGYIGDNIYNADGTNQTKSQTVVPNTAAVYHIRIQNDATSAGTVNVTGTGNASGWTVRYYDALSGGTEITAQVTGNGWTTPSIPAAGYTEIRAEVTPAPTVSGGTVYSILVTSVSGQNLDAVRANTRAAVLQPDNLIKLSSESTYIGDSIYNADGTNQTKSYISNYWNTVTFNVRIQNDGDVNDNFNVTGTGSGSGFTVTYFDALAGGNDITAAVIGAGWTAPTLAPGASTEIRLEITGSSTSDTIYEVLVTSTSGVSPRTPRELDAVKAVVFTAQAQPDAQIKNSDETLFVGDDVYNNSGMAQTKEQEVGFDTTAVYHLKIQNDYADTSGNLDMLRVKGTRSAAGWMVQYFDAITGGNDITIQVIGSGWSTGLLDTREYKIIRLEVTPDSSADTSVPFEVLVTAVSTNDGNRIDVVKASTKTHAPKEPGIEEERGKVFSLAAYGNKAFFTVPKSTWVSLKVYDATGRTVAVLASGIMNSGTYDVSWEAPTGVYFVKMVTPEFTAVRKVAVIH